MRIDFNESGSLDIFPENMAEIVALQHWRAIFPTKTVNEGVEPMRMLPADAITVNIPRTWGA